MERSCIFVLVLVFLSFFSPLPKYLKLLFICSRFVFFPVLKFA